MAKQSRAALERGLSALHEQAGGMIGLYVMQGHDLASAMAAADHGDAFADLLVRATSNAIRDVNRAPASEPKLCLTCPKPLSATSAYSVVIALPEVEKPAHAFVCCVCTDCAIIPRDVGEKAFAKIKADVWPDLRTLEIHPTPGHA